MNCLHDYFPVYKDLSDKIETTPESVRTGLQPELNLVEYRLKSLTDYKMKFVIDDEFTDIHNYFLQNQIEFIDREIIQLQKDIREILKLNSEISNQKENGIR